MIRRLVEEQEIRATHERGREIQPHAPAARELRDRALVLVRREAEAVQEPARAGARGVASDRVQALVQGAIRRGVVR